MYFYTISTNNPNGPDSARTHNEQLNNYLKYGIDMTDSDLGRENEARGKKQMPLREPLPYTIDIHHQSTAMGARGDGMFQTITVLCCDDDRPETEVY